MSKNLSSFAKLIERPPEGSRLRGVPWGLTVHTSGSSLVARAVSDGKSVIDAACDYYRTARFSTHYIVGYGGELYQVYPDSERVMHVGFSAWQRDWYLRGDWQKDGRLPRAVISDWQASWPGRKSPAHLYPSKWPNDDYVAAELPPAGHYHGSRWIPLPGLTMAYPGSRYTAEQVAAVAFLAADLATRHNWPRGFARTARLLGHEDLNPQERPGWDPGAWRGWFDWDRVRGAADAFHGFLLAMEAQ
jgi:hypothetical protein